jgi:CubicO group peptidase (beta-lactamase class C family)
LVHTSEGIPGTEHDYNGNRYALLGGVIEGATGKSFAELLSQRFLIPLAMEDSALNPINAWGGLPLTQLDEFKSTLGWGKTFAHYPSKNTPFTNYSQTFCLTNIRMKKKQNKSSIRISLAYCL